MWKKHIKIYYKKVEDVVLEWCRYLKGQEDKNTLRFENSVKHRIERVGNSKLVWNGVLLLYQSLGVSLPSHDIG
jgi:hypothetical protein